MRAEHMDAQDELINGHPNFPRARDESAAQPAAQKLTPYEPTQAMLQAAKDIDPAIPLEHLRRLWWLMWGAAPASGQAAGAAAGTEAPVVRVEAPRAAELSDEQVVAHLEGAGVEFQRFMGGIAGTKDCWTTAGSQSVRKIADGVRAAIAAGSGAS